MLLKGRITAFFCILAVLSLLPGHAIAGTTGKIAGQVTDGDTREGLAGVNILLEGTTLGSTTDVNGFFNILNVPPGTYSVKASLVGYGSTLITGVRVDIDQTSKANFTLRQQAVDLGEVITVATRRIVKEDVSTSVTAVTSEEVRALPISDITAVAGLQAGVEGGLVIRGGGADQSLFLMDGATLRDPRNNQPITGVPLSAVKEISIERGGFNAEYGQLRSGIVNVVTKEGTSSSYNFTMTGRYRPYAKKYDGISPFDPNSMWLRPYLDPAVAWTGTENGAWDEFTRRQYPKFDGWNAISDRLMSNDDPSDDLSPAAAQRLFEWQHRKREVTNRPDYNLDLGFGGPVPFVGNELGDLRFFFSARKLSEMLMIPLTRPDYVEDFYSLRLTSDVASGMKLNVTGTMGKSLNVAVNGTEQANSTDYIRQPWQIAAQNNQAPVTSASRIFLDSYYSLAEVSHKSFAALFSHVMTPNAYYDVSVEYVSRAYDTEPTRSRDLTKKYELFPGYFVDEAPFGWSSRPDVSIDGMLMGGHTSTARDNTKISSATLKSNLTMQVGRHNQFKGGIELAYNDLNIDYGVVNVVFPESNNFVKWHRFPLRAAAYVQDKLEFEGFVANLGLRADYSSLRAEWPDLDPFNRAYYSSGYSSSTAVPVKESKGQVLFSPRLGISHPISENSKLYFNYGHFRQLSTYEQLLQMSRGTLQQVRTIGDPSLPMARTIAYELGYDHSLFEEYLVQLSAFYRDISDQQDTQTYINARGDVNYAKTTANSYQDTRGFELTLRKTSGAWVTGFVNYTYQVSSGGHFDRSIIYEDPSAQRKYDLRTQNSYQWRTTPTPYARMSVSFFTPENLGSTSTMQSVLGGWNLTLLGDWRAGSNVTWNPNQVELGAPNLQMVDWYNLNLRLAKSIPLGPVKVLLFVDVENVFNTKRLELNSFYDYNDYLDYFGSLHLPASSAYGNIVGSDKAGDFRKSGVPFQPIVQTGDVTKLTSPAAGVIYYEKTTQRYMNFANSQWSQVDPGRLQQVLDDKAYIDMPNQSSFSFLSPRNIFFGITTTIEF